MCINDENDDNHDDNDDDFISPTTTTTTTLFDLTVPAAFRTQCQIAARKQQHTHAHAQHAHADDDDESQRKQAPRHPKHKKTEARANWEESAQRRVPAAAREKAAGREQNPPET